MKAKMYTWDEYHEINQKLAACETECDDLRRKLADASLANASLRGACRSAINWYGPDGDGITDPVRERLIAALALPVDGLAKLGGA